MPTQQAKALSKRIFKKPDLWGFTHGIATVDRIMVPHLKPEVAFVGRSNAGKSTLINAITGRKGLARVSKTPGRTAQLNYFEVDLPKARDQLSLVDLPGYGYISGPEEMGHEWAKLIRAYLLETRRDRRMVVVLMDSRRAVTALDVQMMNMLEECQQPYQAVFTKCDQVPKGTIEAIAQGMMEHEAPHRPFLTAPVRAVSGKKNIGIAELRAQLVESALMGNDAGVL